VTKPTGHNNDNIMMYTTPPQMMEEEVVGIALSSYDLQTLNKVSKKVSKMINWIHRHI